MSRRKDQDWLRERIAALAQINRTEYIVLEMTPVVSVDSTALHVLEDLVLDFRSQGVYVAMAMVGNRLTRTFRKAGLTNLARGPSARPRQGLGVLGG